MNNRPGDLKFFPPSMAAHVSFNTSAGTSVAPMCWVMPPASLSMTLAWRWLPMERTMSSKLVLPWST